ncbi:TonB-dependent receptor domain-containing protein [Methylophilus luteus]|uniref:TonB-dependent receptor domain-containing protein n=1 Tax=Methylophilus luteus TaxID=640108 RepID=A0ABW3F7F7_9PROT
MAEALNISLPKKTYQIPAGDLSDTLPDYAAESGILLGFDPILTQGKRSPTLKGQYGVQEGFDTLLKDSGLEVIQNKDGRYQLRRAVPKQKPIPGAPEKEDKTLKLEGVEVRAKRFYEVGPLPGLGLTKEQIPGNVQTLTAQDIKEAHALSLTDLMNSKLQSVNVNDYQGNPFQMDVQYRGFTAGPQIGTPQGLSAFIDGIRINEPFGDVVNWDLIPLNALASFDVFPGSNPIFGLGTLGGALSMKTKDGFNHSGFNADILTGSFGRKQLQADGGWNNGTVGLFAAGNFFLEDGWRENSPSRVNQLFTKASFRGEKLDLNFSTMVAWNKLVGNGMIPTEMYAQDRNGVYTSPDTTKNQLEQFQLSGSYFVNDNFTITAQAYRRGSKRKQLGADVYTEWGNQTVKRNLAAGEQYTCLFTSTNRYNLPDYYVIPIQGGDPLNPGLFDPADPAYNEVLVNFLFAPTQADAFASLDAYDLANPSNQLKNAGLPDELVARAQNDFFRKKNFQQTAIFTPGGSGLPIIPNGNVESYSNGLASYVYEAGIALSQIKDQDPISQFSSAIQDSYYYDTNGNLHLLLTAPPTNGDVCKGDVGGDNLVVPGPQGGEQTVDGAAYNNGTGTGFANGTPTAVLTNTEIDQITDGASMQLNWNFEHHKLMVGASIDAPSAKYKSGQMLGMLDSERNAYLSPDEIRDQYAAASVEIENNNFKGNQLTKSLYISETWSPIDTLHITGALRYNQTHGKTTIESRTYGSYVFNLAQLEAFPDYFDICVPGAVCPTGYVVPDASNLLNPGETEKFRYFSLNPSLGTTWQASPNLNVYGNVAQGTRVPSVVELGCAFDRTPVEKGTPGNSILVPRSLAENRSCSLPTTLSGDPPLKQIQATSWDLGMRGRFNDTVEWNLGFYRTDLKDDIYMIGYPGNRNFFDTIGETRRQGLEAGISASFDNWRLRLNYALTDATFQDSFWMPANDNSSSVEEFFGNRDYSRRIRVKPGDRMPGVPLHNLNATLGYQITPAWQVGLTAVAHSFAYVRGNENNKHQAGTTIVDSIESDGNIIQVSRKTTAPGITPGYMTFNFQTSYKLNSEWTLGLRVNNIFDKEYFSAGRLGRNPFSPSIYGAIGESGYNFNSTDWATTNFLAPGAPRGAWVSLTYTFDPKK